MKSSSSKRIIKCKEFLFKPKDNEVVNFCYLMGDESEISDLEIESDSEISDSEISDSESNSDSSSDSYSSSDSDSDSDSDSGISDSDSGISDSEDPSDNDSEDDSDNSSYKSEEIKKEMKIPAVVAVQEPIVTESKTSTINPAIEPKTPTSKNKTIDKLSIEKIADKGLIDYEKSLEIHGKFVKHMRDAELKSQSQDLTRVNPGELRTNYNNNVNRSGFGNIMVTKDIPLAKTYSHNGFNNNNNTQRNPLALQSQQQQPLILQRQQQQQPLSLQSQQEQNFIHQRQQKQQPLNLQSQQQQNFIHQHQQKQPLIHQGQQQNQPLCNEILRLTNMNDNIRNNDYHNQQHYHPSQQQNYANNQHSPFVSRCLNSGKRSVRDIEMDREVNGNPNPSDNSIIKRSRFDALSIFNAVIVSPLVAIKNMIMKPIFGSSPKAETNEAPVVESGFIYDYEQQRNALIQKQKLRYERMFRHRFADPKEKDYSNL